MSIDIIREGTHDVFMERSRLLGLHDLRQANSAQLIALLRLHGPMHRAELARRSGLSRTTVSTIVNTLVGNGALEVDDSAESAASRRARGLVSIKRSGRLVAGIDFSFERVRVAVADLSYDLLGEASIDLPPDQNWPQSVETGLAALDQALLAAGSGRGQLVAVGLGLPGPIDQVSGTLGRSSNSIAWAGIHASHDLATRLGVPVLQDNTSRLAAMAELNLGAGRGARNLVFVKLGAGVGSGLVFDGRIYRGALGAAGEIGHITVDENGPACRCGNRGCLEIYARASSILSTLRPSLGPDATITQVLEAAADGNRSCRRVLADVGHVVGTALAGVCNLLNPEKIVIGGRLADADALIIEPLHQSVQRHALPMATQDLDVLKAELGDRAGALGGVALTFDRGDPFSDGPTGAVDLADGIPPRADHAYQ